MFESVTRAVLAHKLVVIAAGLAVTLVAAYGIPMSAYAQFLNGIGVNVGGIGVSVNDEVSVRLDDRVSVDVGEYGQVAVRVDGIEVDTNDEVRVVVPGLGEIRTSQPFGFGFV